MSNNTTVSVVRGGSTVKSNVAVQIDTMNLDEKSYDHGAAPYDQFAIYVLWNDPMQFTYLRSDHLIDAAGNTYAVSNKPEQFDDGHVEIEALQTVGT